MNLLIITQKIDRRDAILGFFHRWVEEFARSGRQIVVICLERGDFSLPANVKVLSLGKEQGASRLKYLWRFYSFIYRERKNYEAVFVHMNPIYIVLGGLFWRLTRKPIGLWYTHRQVDCKLQVAARLADIIFTATPEGFTLPSSKIRVIGHGVDLAAFACPANQPPRKDTIISHIGRITPIKNCDVLIKAVARLKQKGLVTKARFVGVPITSSDVTYQQYLEKIITELNLEEQVEFVGAVPQSELGVFYCQSDLTINLTPTGGIDKVVLESMAAGVPVLSSNQAFAPIFGPLAKELVFVEGNSEDLAQKIETLIAGHAAQAIGQELKKIAQQFSLEEVIKKISGEFNKKKHG